MKIGIGVTTHNRREVLLHSLAEIRRFAPTGAVIVVVDDASEEPYPEATYRFEANAGIARAKNKCLELLDDAGCDEFFLFDDDTYPICSDWWRPYVESDEPHLMYIFTDFRDRPTLRDTTVLYADSKLTAYSHARGCMLYLSRVCLERAGGMNPIFGRWGWEHPNLSERIYNLGLTTFRYADIPGSDRLIHSGDEFLEVKSTILGEERQKWIGRNQKLHQGLFDATEFVPYRATQDVVLTCYFTGQPDPQRGTRMPTNYDDLQPLINSMRGRRLVILHDCLDAPDTAGVEHVLVETSIQPYFQRWISILQYLRAHPEIDRVFCVDATDVELLNDPFVDMGEFLYIGDEPSRLACPWMLQQHRAIFLLEFIRKYGHLPLLNAGLLGGRRQLVMQFLQRMITVYFDALTSAAIKKLPGPGTTDMGVFNYTARTFFSARLKHGREVNTIFKTFSNEGPSWFRHK